MVKNAGKTLVLFRKALPPPQPLFSKVLVLRGETLGVADPCIIFMVPSGLSPPLKPPREVALSDHVALECSLRSPPPWPPELL